MRKKRRRRGGGCVRGQSMNSCIARLHSRQLHHYPHNTPSATGRLPHDQGLTAPLQARACSISQVFTRKGEFLTQPIFSEALSCADRCYVTSCSPHPRPRQYKYHHRTHVRLELHCHCANSGMYSSSVRFSSRYTPCWWFVIRQNSATKKPDFMASANPHLVASRHSRARSASFCSIDKMSLGISIEVR